MRTIKLAALVAGLLIVSTSQSPCQTNLQFTGISVTDEGNIHLEWSSVSNEVYAIQEADSIGSANNGTTTWNLLYDNYPSQGTNTFWLDTGNYTLSPQILNPKDMPMRFYQIVDLGQDGLASDEPTVAILSPTNNSATTGELNVTVMAKTDQPVISGTKLYVDGQEMQIADTKTNYTDETGMTNYEIDTYSINTCEWGNETHILFATAESESGSGDAFEAPPIASGHGVSAFVSVLFSNLVTRVSFSQPAFNPSSGQTQQVTAVFAANCNWTLNIVDINSNVVETATGSGTSMIYDWDGTGTGETNLPYGIYYYYISAATNGESGDSESGGLSGSAGGILPPPDIALSSSASPAASELWAVSPDSDNIVPLVLYPPGSDTSGLTIFRATESEVAPLTVSSSSESTVALNSGNNVSPDFSGGGSSAASQSAPASPQRPPNNPVMGLAGTFGIGYDTYSGNGTNGFHLSAILNGLGISGDYVQLEGHYSGTAPPLLPYKTEANNFISQMQHWGWNNALLKADGQLSINDLIGIGSPFNNVNLGVLMFHGVYGTTIDYNGQPAKQLYYPITSGSSAQYLRLEQMNLGGSGTNGLKWMAILACNSLFHTDWLSMMSAGGYPYNNNLHLLLGVETTNYTSDTILSKWAQYMNYGTSTSLGSYNPLTIRNAWYQAARDAYSGGSYANTIKFVVAGDTACFGDYLQTNNMPEGAWTIDNPVQVWP